MCGEANAKGARNLLQVQCIPVRIRYQRTRGYELETLKIFISGHGVVEATNRFRARAQTASCWAKGGTLAGKAGCPALGDGGFQMCSTKLRWQGLICQNRNLCGRS